MPSHGLALADLSSRHVLDDLRSRARRNPPGILLRQDSEPRLPPGDRAPRRVSSTSQLPRARSLASVSNRSSLTSTAMQLRRSGSRHQGLQHESSRIDGLASKTLEEMGFSKDRIHGAQQNLPMTTKPTFDNLLQALIETGPASPLPSRPSSMSITSQSASSSTPGVPSVVMNELLLMGFTREQVLATTSSMDSPSVQTALEALLANAQETVVDPVPEVAVTSPTEHALFQAEEEVQLARSCELSSEGQALFDHIVSAHKDISRNATLRMLQLTDAAVRQMLMNEEQRAQLHDEMQSGDLGIVRDILAIIGVRNEPGMSIEDGDMPWECSICFSEQRELGWRCSEGHMFCHTCMGHHVEATIFPTCPHVGCCFELEEADLVAIQVSSSRLEAFRDSQLRNAVDTLGSSKAPGDDEVVIRCHRLDCSNAATVALCAPRCCFACPCGSPPLCTGCRQAPYHFHADCSEVQAMRQDWLDWISGGREAYFGFDRKFAKYQASLEDFAVRLEAHAAQAQSLREGLQRHRELESDEQWKQRHCRLCPGCRRPLEKIDGCDSMVCGQNYHGGNHQPGCGRKFSWSSADPYVAAGGDTHDVEMPPPPSAPARPGSHRGNGVFHPFTTCSICCGDGIVGLRFRCIHCEDFSVCSRCEPRLPRLHNTEHVFQIMYESDYDWSSVVLPNEMPIHLARSGARMPTDCAKHTGANLEGMSGSVMRFVPYVRGSVKHRRALALGEKIYGQYQIGLRGVGIVTVSAEHVVPLIVSSDEARQLIDGTFQV
eukprot:gnl/TRDRNA2_/TRDRNA2_186968_c0_seq1.p1 gnl/TRDRNA2_/TRDRNA2_186968_c0~~gnl/TRDRNA2_/TRDRNA2_186968_c0_seq1.p1  ORF type:complete len:786 (-),score=96.66 gnl/TRDRNA2_/TRDRNA2_186968_c0_seq1:134-2455(-)